MRRRFGFGSVPNRRATHLAIGCGKRGHVNSIKLINGGPGPQQPRPRPATCRCRLRRRRLPHRAGDRHRRGLRRGRPRRQSSPGLRRRHRRARHRPLPARGHRRDPAPECRVDPHVLHRGQLRAAGGTGRTAQRHRTRRRSPQDAADEQRSRGGGVGRQAGPRPHRPCRVARLRGRLPRPDQPDDVDDLQVRAVQEGVRPVRAGDLPDPVPQRAATPAGHEPRAVRPVVDQPPRGCARLPGRSGGARGGGDRAGAG